MLVNKLFGKFAAASVITGFGLYALNKCFENTSDSYATNVNTTHSTARHIFQRIQGSNMQSVISCDRSDLDRVDQQVVGQFNRQAVVLDGSSKLSNLSQVIVGNNNHQTVVGGNSRNCSQIIIGNNNRQTVY